ncbi:MAG: hypothetical protein INH12_00490 [Cupriavidus sp.]|uniref:hypothetical protein n=1 Tax=Cupriavidus sp. TaxID=1873897 RepID=UPI0025C22989|nr:hypothetical protein [Cupriavidus sp.]MCA3186377.1 hypothetical protein [Cupriavidus sp.]MCA3188550.1 hypothetical protein [Cupriavidus sp.]MCA3235200.1 hypothetical protein [Cupriavidus sp.]
MTPLVGFAKRWIQGPVTSEFLKKADEKRFIWIRDNFLTVERVVRTGEKLAFLMHVAKVKKEVRETGYVFFA